MENFADLHCDYLICSTSYTTATGMSNLLNIKHVKIIQKLTRRDYDSKFLWRRVKPYVQELTQSKDIITRSFDDSIEEKLYTADSELNCWYYDHCFSRSIKDVNFLTVLVEFVKKDLWVIDPQNRKIET